MCDGGVEQEDEGVEEAAERMRALLEPFLLRRLKSDVATQLAAKTQQVCSAHLAA